MKLYYAPGACSMVPHIVLREAEQHFDLERVDLKTHLTASGRDFKQINSKGYVPALQLDDPAGDVLTEVPAVVQYIGDLVPDLRLVPANGTNARYHLQEWLNFIATEIHKQFGPLFARDTPAVILAKQRAKINERLIWIEQVVVDRPYLMGETFTVADAYLFVMLEWCERYGMELQLWPNLDEYESRISARPAVEATFAAEGLRDRHRYRRSA